MADQPHTENFFGDSKTLLKDYIDTRLEIYRLQGIRMFSKYFGLLAWVLISAFLMMLVLVFIGLVLGFWFAELTGSYVYGFGIATLILILIILLLTAFRKQLFVNPVIRTLIKKSVNEEEE